MTNKLSKEDFNKFYNSLHEEDEGFVSDLLDPLWEWIKAYAKQEREVEREKLEGIANLDEWITINRILKILIKNEYIPFLRISDTYQLEKLTDEVHSRYRKGEPR